jgi:AraC-like DNA-binding protein
VHDSGGHPVDTVKLLNQHLELSEVSHFTLAFKDTLNITPTGGWSKVANITIF